MEFESKLCWLLFLLEIEMAGFVVRLLLFFFVKFQKKKKREPLEQFVQILKPNHN